MKTKVLLILTMLIASNNAFASNELATEYLDRRVSEVCAGSNKTVTLGDLESLLRQSVQNGSCNIYRVTHFNSAVAAKVPTFDGYNDAVISVTLIQDTGDTNSISATTLRMRDMSFCAFEDGNKISVAYDFFTSEPARFTNSVGNFLYETFVSQPQALNRRIVFEFESGQLKYAGSKEFYVGKNMAEATLFQCGHASYSK